MIILLTCSLFATDPRDHYYDVGSLSEYTTIQAAVNHSQDIYDLDNTHNVYITIYPNDVYTENIEFIVNANYHFIGSNVNGVKIQPLDNSMPIFNALSTYFMSQSGELYLENLAFMNLRYQNQEISENNCAIKFSNLGLDVKNCIFNPELDSIFGSDIVISQTGGYSDNDYKYLNIENSIFNNGTYAAGSHEGYTICNTNVSAPELSISISNSEFHENNFNNRLIKLDRVCCVTFENNTIFGTNISDEYPAIDLEAGSSFSNYYIRDNYIKDIGYLIKSESNVNYFDIEDNVILNCVQMDLKDVRFFRNNAITTESKPNSAYSAIDIKPYYTSLDPSSEISANTFIELNDIPRVSLELSSALITNNIFSNYANNVDIQDYDTLLANCFDSDFTLDNQITNFSQNLNIKGQNHFVDIENEDFNLTWPSPAIGNGYSSEFDDLTSQGYDINLITYQDDTVDIGAIPFDQDRKEYKTFLPGSYTKNWTGFPAIDITLITTNIGGSSHILSSNNMHVVFEDLFEQDNGVRVDYQEVVAGHLQTLAFDYSQTVDENLLVSAYKGYKVRTTDVDVSSWFGGLLQDPDASIPLPRTSEEIWLGYPVTITTPALVAFSGILNNLQTIKHKDWSYFWTGSEWMGRSLTGNDNLELGDFVAITFRPNVTPPRYFNWTYSPFIPGSSFRYKDASFVTFEEKQDYQPFYVDIDEEANIEEIALYADNQCIGGAKTQGEPTVMIKAFMQDIPENSEISIVTFTGAKSSKKINQISEYNQTLHIWDSTNTVIKDNRSLYHISIRKDSDSLVETNSIITSNYPNPFNPETTIEFNNPVQGEVNVNIYNLKGQLVKKLLQDNLSQGVHKVVWNGTDSNEKQVSSGVYFYKINSANKESITKKIILMK